MRKNGQIFAPTKQLQIYYERRKIMFSDLNTRIVVYSIILGVMFLAVIYCAVRNRPSRRPHHRMHK